MHQSIASSVFLASLLTSPAEPVTGELTVTLAAEQNRPVGLLQVPDGIKSCLIGK
jgi:hypothetical protein